jgi:glucose/mannose transport system permease protein
MVKSKRNTAMAILVLLPSILLVGVFIYGFIGHSIYISLTDWGTGSGLAEHPVKNFIGLDNYHELFTGFINARFRQDLINTVFYSSSLVFFCLTLGLFMAILLDQKPKGEGFFRTVFLFPMALSFVVTGTIWRWLLAPNGGINLLPRLLGLPKASFLWISSRTSILNFNWQNLPRFLAVILALAFLALAYWQWTRRHSLWQLLFFSAAAAFCALYTISLHRVFPPILAYEEIHGFNLATIGVIMAGIWQYSGYTMALYLAGLRGLPETLHDAAMVDGASETQYYLKIAIPGMWPITLSALIVLAHISLKLFALIFAIAGADNASTGHPSVLMYLVTFRANNFAIGAAISVILFIMAALFIIPYLVHSHQVRKENA